MKPIRRLDGSGTPGGAAGGIEKLPESEMDPVCAGVCVKLIVKLAVPLTVGSKVPPV